MLKKHGLEAVTQVLMKTYRNSGLALNLLLK